MLGPVKPNSLELRTDSFIAATACPEVFLVQVSPKSNYYNSRYLQWRTFFCHFQNWRFFAQMGLKQTKGKLNTPY